MFNINPSGFQITFANGITASVQFDGGNYCEHRNIANPSGASPKQSRDAEVIAWDKDGKYITKALGWRTPDEVAAFLKEMSEK